MLTVLPLASRRLAINTTLGVVLCSLALGLTSLRAEERTLSIYNIHTKETSTITYKRDGKFLDDGLKQVNHAMRDWRRNEPTKMDPELVDLIWEIHRELGSKKPVHLISGYRSPKTNKMLRKTRGGQAKRSRHMLGLAADIHFPDVPVEQIRNSALIREKGGVGYYPRSGIPFVHVDTSRVRHWPRLPRKELAVLFPSGRSKHVPSDGRPITPKDHRLALASLKKRGGEMPWALRKKKPQTVLASLGPATLPYFGGKSESEGDEASNGSEKDDGLTNAANLAAGALPVPTQARAGGDWKMPDGSEEEEEHEDEMLFDPLPIVRLLTDVPIAQLEIQEEQRPFFEKTHLLFGEPSSLVSTEFEDGLQIENLYAARRFEGPAITLVQNLALRTTAEAPQVGPTRTAAQKLQPRS